MIVGPHSTKLQVPQSWDTESDQLGVPAVLTSYSLLGPVYS